MQMNLNIDLLKFLLILFRCLGFILITPVFGRHEIPAQVKIGLSALLSIIVYPFVSEVNFTYDLWILAANILKEFITGITMGYMSFLLFSSLYLAGELIDMEMGFGIVNVLDVQSNTQVPLMGNYFYILTILLFLTVNGHHVLISTIIKSYDLLPLGKATILQEGLLQTIIVSFKEMFLLGIRIALPVVAVIFFTDLALGIIARTVSQMNVFMVGLPVKIAVGLISMIMIFPMFFIIIDSIYNGSYESILKIVMGMLVRP